MKLLVLLLSLTLFGNSYAGFTSCFNADERPESLEEVERKLRILNMQLTDAANMRYNYQEIWHGLSHEARLGALTAVLPGAAITAGGVLASVTVSSISSAAMAVAAYSGGGALIGTVIADIYKNQVLPMIENKPVQVLKETQSLRSSIITKRGTVYCGDVKGTDFLKAADEMVKYIYANGDLELDLIDRLTFARNQRNTVLSLQYAMSAKELVLQEMINELEMQKDVMNFLGVK